MGLWRNSRSGDMLSNQVEEDSISERQQIPDGLVISNEQMRSDLWSSA